MCLGLETNYVLCLQSFPEPTRTLCTSVGPPQRNPSAIMFVISLRLARASASWVCDSAGVASAWNAVPLITPGPSLATVQ
jgi:hypothetical protein